jgi:hypothetical protein
MLARSRLGASLGFLGLAVAGCTGHGSGGGFAAGSTATPAATSSGTTNGTAPVTTAVVRTAPANLATGPCLVLDASGQGAFFDLPFPLDARLGLTGSLELTGFPNPKQKSFIQKSLDLAENETRGASPTGTIYFRFDAPVNAPVDDAAASMVPGANVFVVDIDPASSGRLTRHPVHVALTQTADSCRPVNLLQVLPVPGRGLRPNTTHAAIVLRALGAPGTAFLGQAPALTDLLAGRAPVGAAGASLEATYAPLIPALRDLGISPDDLAAAAVFTTGDPTESLVFQAAALDQAPAPQPLGAIEIRDQYPTFTALKGVWSPPQFQKGIPPFVLGGGEQITDAQGLPVPQWWDRAQFQLSVPKGKMPAKGFPLYFWVHGTGGDAARVIDLGRYPAPNVPSPPGTGIASNVAPIGWATACAAGPLSPTRIGFLSAEGYIAYDFFNPIAMRDNFAQMILEMVLFRRLLLDLRIDPALCPGTDASASPDGKVRFDPDMQVVGGQSLGSYLAGMLAALLPDWKGVILTGAGGSWVEFPFGPLDPCKPEVIVNLTALPNGESIDLYHPFVTAFDLALGRADNTHYVEKVIRDPLPNHAIPHVLVIEGHGDEQVPDHLQRALMLSMGVDFAGPEVQFAPPDESLLPALPWGGLRQIPYPVSGNVTLPGGGVRTACVVRYQRDWIREGHYVSFQLSEPKRQVREFLSDLAAGTVPVVK